MVIYTELKDKSNIYRYMYVCNALNNSLILSIYKFLLVSKAKNMHAK